MVNGLLAIFGIFAAGYLMRPIGGIVIGYLGDKKGRSYALKLSILLMSIPMLITAIMPTYQQIGNYAVLILIFTRMLQGFSVGGEYTGVLIMLIEHSPIHKRGLITSFASISSSLGVLLSAMTVAILSSTFTPEQMIDWGWRVAFGIGAILAIISFFMQKSVAESPMYIEFKKDEKESTKKTPFFSSLTQYKRPLLYVFVLTGYLGIAYYTMAAYLPNSLISLRDISPSTILWISTLFSAVYAFTAPIWGYLTDIIGRKIVILVPTLILMLTAAPLSYIFHDIRINHGNAD
jgi:MFS transporter, MHS family, proline/betaine transporter